jgi:sialic acid synthase SpsE
MSTFHSMFSRDMKRRDVYVIAEIGLNHNGSLELAKSIIDIAYKSGVNAVKLQKRTVSRLAVKEILDAADLRFPSLGNTYGEIRRRLEFSFDQYLELKNYAENLNLDFLVTPFDEDAVDFLEPLQLMGYKLASHSVRNLDLLNYVAKKQRPTILSTGMSTLEEIDDAVQIFRLNECPLSLLHCVSSYPTESRHLNLDVIKMLEKRYGLVVGYSGHEKSQIATLVAVALGAQIIERHVTTSHNLEGFDHKLSLTESQLVELVKNIREIEIIRGSNKKVLQDCELVARHKYDVSMVSKTNITKGTMLTEAHITWKNPGTGIPRRNRDLYVGRRVNQDIPRDVLFNNEMFD